MLNLSLNINNIQNPLQRHYHRDQTILPFEENLKEDTDEVKKKVFHDNHQNNCKRQCGSDCIVLWLKDFSWSKDKISNLLFN